MSTTSDDLELRLGEALHRRAGTVAPRLSVDDVRVGARRRRSRRRGGAVAVCVALVAVVIPFLARSQPQSEPASPQPAAPMLSGYAVLDDPASQPITMAVQAGGQPMNIVIPAIDVWVDGDRTVVVRTQPRASDLPPVATPTTAVATTAATSASGGAAGFPDPPPWADQPVTSVSVRGGSGVLQRLADDQFAVWLPGLDGASTAIVGRGMSAGELVAIADAATEVDGALRPANGFSLAEQHPALPAATPAPTWAYASYGGAVISVDTSRPLADRTTLESAGWADVGRRLEVDGREVLVSERYGTTWFMWIDPSGLVVGVGVTGTAATLPVGVKLLDQTAWLTMSDAVSSALRTATTPAARASLAGTSLEVRRSSDRAALCVATACVDQPSVDETPSHFTFSGIVDGRWRLAGYREAGTDEDPTPRMDDVHVTTPDGTELDVVWTRRGDAFWYTVEVPDGVIVVSTDVGMTLGGIVGSISRPLSPTSF